MRIRGATAVWSCLVAFMVAACDQPGTGPVAEAPAETTNLFRDPVESDRPAPEVFEDEGVGIWDGRPTLGGVWIAHPLARQPERVRIENMGNGRSVIGALFRRDTALTGPAIQLSSDTARSIGIVPGEPTPLRIVALRRTVLPAEEAPEEATALATEVESEAAADPVAAETPATEATAPTAAALIAVDADPDQPLAPVVEADAASREPAPAPIAPVSVDAGEETRDVGEPAAPLIPDVDRPDSNDTDRTDAPEAEEALPATPITSAEPPAPRPRGPDPDVHVQPARATPVVVLSEPPAPVATSPATLAEPLTEAETLPPEATTPETLPPETLPTETLPTEAPFALSQPYVQIGMFGITDNARRLRRELEAEGLPVRLVERRAGGTVFTRVLIGPAATAADLQRYLDAARGRGFRDAIAVRG